MSFDGQIIDIFVSSPGDVSTHRDTILSIVQSWNQRNGKNRKLFFNCLRWEDLVAPDIGQSGQSVINDQIGDDYDIFLGVMWSRFGSPTTAAESGTEEEFDRAVLRHEAGVPLKVSFLFCTTDVPQSQLDGLQYAKVQEFKSKVRDAGCLTRDFVDEASLTNAINLILDRFANSWVNPPASANSKNSDQYAEVSGKNLAPTNAPEAEPDDDGLFDVLEEFKALTARFTEAMTQWAGKLNEIAESTSRTTEKLSIISTLGKPDTTQVKNVLSPMIKAMENFANWSEDKISEVEVLIDSLSGKSLKLIAEDFNEEISDIMNAKHALEELSSTIVVTNESIGSFVESLEKSPRIDKKLNRANRRVVEYHRRLIEKNRIFKGDMDLAAAELASRVNCPS